LEEFYQQYETNFEDQEKLRSIFIRVLGEIEQLIPNLTKTRWRKKSAFYTLFVKLARHVGQLPLAADQRTIVAEALRGLASAVDRVITEEVAPEEVGPRVVDYVKYVERAASDLGPRKERERVLDEVLKPVFIIPDPPTAPLLDVM